MSRFLKSWRTRVRVHSALVALVAAQMLVLCLALAEVPAARGADLFTELRTFPGVVLVPPTDLAPFSLLEPWRVEMNRPRPGSTALIRGR